jgi:hypothetical protein
MLYFIAIIKKVSVFVNSLHESIRQACKGFDAHMLPGILSEDCLFADLGIDLVRVMLGIFVALGVMLVAGLIVIPVLEQSVKAQGPPEKAQTILSTPAKDRVSVASEGKRHGSHV